MSKKLPVAELLSVIALLTACYSSVYARGHTKSGNAGIGFVDLQAVLQHSSAGQSLNASIEPRQQKLKKAAEEKLKELKEEQEALAKLPADKATAQTAVLQKKVSDWNSEAQKQEAELNQAAQPAVQKIREAMNAAITDIADENKLNAVLPLQGAFYANKGIDLTSETIRRVNKLLPKVEVKE